MTNLTEAQIYYFALKTADEIPNWSNISNVVNECPHHPTHDVGDWWMWKVYYNTDGEGGIPLENTVYEILNVFEVDVYTNVTPCSGCTPVTVGPCDHSNINMDEVDRQRAKPASIGDARVVFRDTEQWAGMYHMLPVRQDALMEVFDTALGIGDGDMLANNWFTHSDDFGNTTYGYPSPVGETWYEHQYILAVGAITQEFEYDSVINVTSYIENYDMSDPANCPDVQGVGVYDVGYSEQLFEGTTDIAMEQWYSCEVQTPVRRIDYVTYYGYEDRVIIAYEVADFQKSNLVVSDKSGNIDVSINVTNPTASTQTYNMLLLIMDMDAQTTPATGSPSDYFNGKTVFPDMANPETPGTWPYYDAIQQVEVAGGATETVTWTDVYISDGGPYTVWCSGLTESW